MFRKIIKIDVHDLNWDISSEKINQVAITSSGKYGILEGVFRVFYHILKSFFYFKFNVSNFRCKTILYSGTRNQSLALNRLSLNDKQAYIKFGNQSDYFNNNSFEFFPYILSLLFIPFFTYRYLTEKSKFKKKIMCCRLDRYLFSYGLCFFFSIVLKKKHTSLIIMSNDHSVWQRCLLHIAKKKGIKTAYVQHANVSSLFPKLAFDYAFLDGNYAKNTYGEGECKVYMVGCLRFEDTIHDIKNKNTKTRMLLCFNRIDNKEKISEIINFFIEKKHSFDVRLHPSESRQDIIRMVSGSEHFDNVTTQDLNSILNTYTHCFSGTSSVFLEASLCGLKCFSISDIYNDYYGYKKDGIIQVFPSLVDVNFDSIICTRETSKFLYHYSEPCLERLMLPSKRISYILKRDGMI